MVVTYTVNKHSAGKHKRKTLLKESSDTDKSQPVSFAFDFPILSHIRTIEKQPSSFCSLS